MTKQQILLPKTYNDEQGNYPQHKGKPKLSISQKTSWDDNKYHQDYREHYFMDGPRKDNAFSLFGSQCGEWLETSGETKGELISDKDVKTLKKIDRHKDAQYEVEIVIDRGWYVIQGFIDYEVLLPEGLSLEDYKTGSIKNKGAFYSSEEYQQTTMYCYQREQEGQKIIYSGVTLLDRAGNPFKDEELYLTGDIVSIPTPYSTIRAENFLKEVDKTAKDISFAYKIYLAVTKIKI